jgi:hypothetical protein
MSPCGDPRGDCRVQVAQFEWYLTTPVTYLRRWLVTSTVLEVYAVACPANA